MKYSFNVFNHSTYYDLPPTLPQQIHAAALAGYDHIGLDVMSVLEHERRGLPPQRLAESLGEADLPCYELVSLSISADVDATTRSLANVLRLAPILGARQILAVATGPADQVAAGARRCVEALADAGLGFALEFLPTRHIDSIDAALHLAELAGVSDHDAFRLVVESWHFFRGPSTWRDLEALPLDRIGFVQFADAPEMITTDLHAESMHRRVLPGEGVLDLAGFCDALVGKGYDGVVSVEVLSDTWRRAPLDTFAAATLHSTRNAWEAASARA
ncbi:sugar phosphate isomerase/epimerase family protein [Yinghuangia seranimata]|uniref:sugar phosphate isomerase/epimerase family protein n=1 Tax=Yinghuangia seranimata TaxID=408067 RepID=UPI00248C139E|nr:TIM barrel protein [Yinghuangia seranimata]MDI2131336.1 TIM barrel protein [Yinghuangia seranimata]